jgi:hypothetical protein
VRHLLWEVSGVLEAAAEKNQPLSWEAIMEAQTCPLPQPYNSSQVSFQDLWKLSWHASRGLGGLSFAVLKHKDKVKKDL